MRRFLGAILACGAVALPGTSPADSRVCYWNAEGLPYSLVPPPEAGEPAFSGGPMQAIRVILNASPQLIYQHACGLIGEADLVKPREIYRRWGCSPDSSIGQMVESLASNGVLVSPAMSFVGYITEKYGDEFAEQCQLLKGIEPICYLVSAESPAPKDAEMYPQCMGLWRRIRAFEEFFAEVVKRDSVSFSELMKKDEALIESASVD